MAKMNINFKGEPTQLLQDLEVGQVFVLKNDIEKVFIKIQPTEDVDGYFLNALNLNTMECDVFAGLEEVYPYEAALILE